MLADRTDRVGVFLLKLRGDRKQTKQEPHSVEHQEVEVVHDDLKPDSERKERCTQDVTPCD